jgi:hypothetical protein
MSAETFIGKINEYCVLDEKAPPELLPVCQRIIRHELKVRDGPVIRRWRPPLP